MAPLFRTDQIGSLLRPASLLQARKDNGIYADDITNNADAQAATSAAIRDVVAKQLAIGYRPLTSGEYERTIFYSNFFERLGGMECVKGLRVPEDVRPGIPFWPMLAKMGFKTREANIATGKIRHVVSPNLEAWEMLKAATPEEHWGECKIAMPSIAWEHLQLPKNGAYLPGVYATDREYFKDLAAAYRAELRVLYDAGLRSVQIDDPNLTHFLSPEFCDALRADGEDPDELLALYVWAHNEAIRDRPEGMHIGIHLCRGNIPGTKGFVQASYEYIAESVLAKLNHDTLYLEFDDAEATGSFESLWFIPKDTNVVLGLVSTKTPEMEELDELVAKVYEAADAIARGQGRTREEVVADTLAVSPQCGFSSSVYTRGVGTEENMWKKLELVRDVARKVWG